MAKIWSIAARVLAVAGILLAVALFVSAACVQRLEADLSELQFVGAQQNSQVSANDVAGLWLSINQDVAAMAPWLRWHADWLSAESRWYQLGAQMTGIDLSERFARVRRAHTVQLALLQQRPQLAAEWFALARIQFDLDPSADVWKASLKRAFDLRFRGNALAIDLLRFRRQAEAQFDPILARQVDAILLVAFRDRPVEMADAAFQINRLDWICRADWLTDSSSRHRQTCQFFRDR